ncbi:porin [Undibacterium arcticum]
MTLAVSSCSAPINRQQIMSMPMIKTVQLGSSIPVGAGNILASWAQTRRAGSVVGADLKRNTASVGYDYVLSKRTDLYTVYMYDKISSQDQANSILLGIRHRF